MKDIFKSWQIWLLIIFLIGAAIAISPNPWAEGVRIQSVEDNSSAQINGLQPGLLIESIDGQSISNVNDFTRIASSLYPRDIVNLNTDKGVFKFLVEEVDNTTSIGITAEDVSTSNLKKGLDLAGGVRALLKPAGEIDAQTMQDVITITEKRLNTYGISDITVRQVSDLEGNAYILVEVPGANRAKVADLLEKQGKFEAKIANNTIFRGGEDIKSVCRSPDCSGIDPQAGCGQSGDGWSCQFQFQVDISIEAAKRHAEATRSLDVIVENGKEYLSEKLDLYLDDELVDSLFISVNLKGSEDTTFVIQGPGTGSTRADANNNAIENMKQMQTILITGSLPVKLDIAKMDIVSPTLGENFLQIAIIALIVAIIAVGTVVFIRYRKLKIAVPIMLIGLSEVFIIFGVAALINWRLDLAAIAGILAAVGTGVDDQIIVTDEALQGEKAGASWKERIKRAFFIIFAAYFTTVVALAPLGWMGAGLVKGFAVTTFIGITIGVFITRPAFAKIIESLLK